MNTSKKNSYQVFLFLAPVMAGIIIFRLWPLLKAFSLSLYDYYFLSSTRTFVGLENFKTMMQDPLFFNSLKVSFLYALMRVSLQVIVALLLALYVNMKFKGVTFIRTVIFVPVVMSLVATATIWNLMYHPTYGIINAILGFFGIPPQEFLINPNQALPSIVLSAVWKDIGFSMIIFLAGIKNVPGELYEAASIDGASSWSTFFKITLPLLKRTTMYVLVVTTIFTFQDFASVYIMTRGGPMDSTRNLIYYIYENAFVYNQAGYANALSVFFFLVLVLLSLVEMKLVGRENF